ncbi:hypothetical protein [Actinoplanes sp. NBRC 103695]|uniref:hypothetical protein n=1 Tax=Actinoplanes sp. NBRC 103695 TaxID=3032202 RepID=UPI002557C682|nr:hypothetical protein [Actinoplanes sp. NBRC 103695]
MTATVISPGEPAPVSGPTTNKVPNPANSKTDSARAVRMSAIRWVRPRWPGPRDADGPGGRNRTEPGRPRLLAGPAEMPVPSDPGALSASSSARAAKTSHTSTSAARQTAQVPVYRIALHQAQGTQMMRTEQFGHVSVPAGRVG